MPKKHRTININEENIDNTANLLQKIAKELYQRNIDIRKEQARLDELLSRVAEIIFAVDENYKISLFNSIAESIFSTPKEKAIGTNADKVVKIFDLKNEKQISIISYAFKEKLFSLPKVKIRIGSNGNTVERIYMLKSTFVDFDGLNREAIISLADITHEVEIEALKDDFISVASHELKTPISILKNNIWMLKNTTRKNFDERETKYMNEIEKGVERLRKLIDELLNVSRIDQNRLILDIKELDLNSIIESSLITFSETFIAKKIKINKFLQKSIKISADTNKMQEILDNFISNAIKYSNPQNPEITIATTVDGFNAKISITDNGNGIPKADYPKIFTKFGRATEGLKLTAPGSSTGLGLYITKGYIEIMKGSVGFESEESKGTTFWFTVPLVRAV